MGIWLISYSGGPRPADLARIARFPIHPLARKVVSENLAEPQASDLGSDGIVLTDALNPIDSYDAWLRESVRKKILRNTHLDILLHSG